MIQMVVLYPQYYKVLVIVKRFFIIFISKLLPNEIPINIIFLFHHPLQNKLHISYPIILQFSQFFFIEVISL